MHRAFWAIPRTLKTKSGELSNVTFGMASMLMAIMQHEEPDHLVVCFDEGGETFRHQENETYKDGRAETPDEFYVQIPRVFALVDAFGFAQVSDSQYEADDFLCAYAKAGEHEGMQVTVVTGDRDAFQLASEKTRIAIPHKGYQHAEYLGPDEVYDKLGVHPEQVASYKGLCGDSSDNLPGVVGIGPKTAANLLQQYNSLTGVYQHLSDISPTVRAKLERDKEQAFFCERMAELVCDITLPVALPDTALENLDAERLLEFFQDMNFTLLTKRLQRFVQTEYGKQHFTVPELSAVNTAGKGKDQMTLF